jgi:sugar phosphate isomerase/epimerase
MQIGVMMWAGRDSLAEMKAAGVTCGQLGVAGDYNLDGAAEKWKTELAREGFMLVTVFCAYKGESYADIPTVQRTVGFIPPGTREERERRTYEVSDFAAAIGVKKIACHVGFVPEEPAEPGYVAVRDMVRRICDHAAGYGQSFCLETGQEPARTLLRFFTDVNRPNLGINFDPANMILYGTGDPIEALGILAKHVETVHCKDGEWPPKGVPGALGTERPLGQGSVGMVRFLRKLKEIGYTGTLNIEREVEDQRQRLADIAMAVKLLENLRG